ncbi:hypothetical protein L218DRAFT_866634 [Marasmius fiardii PR-910]|nr:hypothetical protein L218DRAFT_866634 [Marasmius fiardii PR-910]
MHSNSNTIDFSSTSLASCYAGFYAKVLDNVFTAAECAELIQLAASQPGGWKPAGLSAREEQQTVHRNFRNSERVIVIDEGVSQKIYEKLKPLVEEIAIIEPKGPLACITGKVGRKQGPTWVLDRVNPRLSFLRYGPGHYFKPHCDGLNDLSDGALKSFVTLHLYLTDETTSPQVLSGGATRFWSPDKKEFLDVEPKIGRVLVFQQRMLVHSGEAVKSGMKYTMRSDFMFRQLKQ